MKNRGSISTYTLFRGALNNILGRYAALPDTQLFLYDLSPDYQNELTTLFDIKQGAHLKYALCVSATGSLATAGSVACIENAFSITPCTLFDPIISGILGFFATAFYKTYQAPSMIVNIDVKSPNFLTTLQTLENTCKEQIRSAVNLNEPASVIAPSTTDGHVGQSLRLRISGATI